MYKGRRREEKNGIDPQRADDRQTEEDGDACIGTRAGRMLEADADDREAAIIDLMRVQLRSSFV